MSADIATFRNGVRARSEPSGGTGPGGDSTRAPLKSGADSEITAAKEAGAFKGRMEGWCFCLYPLRFIVLCLHSSGKEPLKMHCRDCALVTSSGHLLRSRQGPQIDQTECVIRMNDAPTRGYGHDVGNRTSLRVIAHSSIQRILRNRHDLLNVSQGTVFIFWGPSSYMRRDGKGQVYNNLQLLSQVLPRLKAFMTTRHKMLQFDELFKQETGKDR
ncbi:alpha-N-acetylgalactosaminide alpha-2,6-sialyltransferase 5 [Mirounga angustirostris]|uniref:alpha-N-acetylgalactosaminide alpha-2,6-sialyltransferase 5 n=1 Tax=Mirounga angustirostris TaxID=9716 RepID=UPI00313AAF0C